MVAKLAYFRDGIRQVDYVVAFCLSSSSVSEPIQAIQDFLVNILQHGVDIEIEVGDGEPSREFGADSNVGAFVKNRLIFAKLHVQLEALPPIAEILHFQKAIDTENGTAYDSFLTSAHCAFKGFSDRGSDFFTPLERILAVEYIIKQVSCSSLQDRKSGAPKTTLPLPTSCSMEKSFKEKGIITTFSLHEPKVDSHRSELMENWASERKILTLQDFDSIRNYLGEKVAFSFAWIQFHIRSFLCLFILALVVSLIPVFLRGRPLSISEEVCMRDSTPFIMCPPCKAKVCRFRRLNKSCGDIIWTYFFDSPASVVLAFVAPIFGSLCLHLWTYQQSALAHRWHMQNYRVAEKPARRHFIEMLNPVHRSLLNVSCS
eukprot:TsM_000176900 transcript=TsM_000176900 gene=TsM_000176900